MKIDINQVMPDWLAVLRAHDHQLDAMPQSVRMEVQRQAKRMRIDLWRPGRDWTIW